MKHIKPLNDLPEVNWKINRYCNYACSYCSPNQHLLSDIPKDFSFYRKQFDVIHNLMKGRPYKVSLDGGEPTQIPDLLLLCEYIYSKGVQLNISSNGSKPVEYYEELLQYCTYVTFSLHFEYIKLKPFLKKMARLHKRFKNRILVTIMTEIGYEREFEKTCELFKKYGINFIPSLVEYSEYATGKKQNLFYSEEFTNIINRYFSSTHNNDVVVDGKETHCLELKDRLRNKKSEDNYSWSSENSFKGWKCKAPSYSIGIKDNKLIGGNCGIVEYGELENLSSIELVEYIECDGRICQCTADLRAEKWDDS